MFQHSQARPECPELVAPSPCPVPAPPDRAALRAGKSGGPGGAVFSLLQGKEEPAAALWALAGDTSLPGQRPGLIAHPTAGGVPLCVSVSFTVSPSPRGLTQTAPGRCGPAGSASQESQGRQPPRAR